MEPPSPAPAQLDRALSGHAPKPGLVWHDLHQLTIEGKGWVDTQSFYDRLPARAEGLVPDEVWRLGQRSAGLTAGFETDSPTVAARWTLRFPHLQMDHMSAVAVSGLDLYARESAGWRWMGVGREPQYPHSASTLAAEISPAHRSFRLYLPLYNGVESLELGLEPGATLNPAPATTQRPICCYGTSIVQGACASRPGLTYPALLGRRLDRGVINLGMSGNGRADASVVDLLAELDVSAYVIDCLPNMTAELVAERMPALIDTLRRRRPATPIVLVENIVYPRAAHVARLESRHTSSNRALREVFEAQRTAHQGKLWLTPCDELLGSSGEATVDGTHPNDLGLHALAAAIEPTLRAALGAADRPAAGG